jgi:hypothetical protein
MSWKHTAGLLVVGALVAAGACSSEESSSTTPTGVGANGTGAGGAGGGTSTGGSGGNAIGCVPACAAPQYCSVVGQCIDAGTCLDDGDCGPGLECDPSNVCVPGGGCGSEEVAITPVPPNLLLVLDRSCSMRRDLDGNLVGPSKWQLAIEAITQMTTDFATEIRFGLILFPDITLPNCAQTDVAVPVGPDTADDIGTLLTAALETSDPLYCDGPCVTNIDTAMELASQQTVLTDPDRESFAMLISDGAQAGCDLAGSDAGTEQILADMFTAGVPTFIVGFGGAVDEAQLAQFAVAGGVPLAGDPNYYQADSDAELQQALDDIATATLGCVFVLESTPEDPDEIYVFFDNDPTPVDRDESHTDGWDYDAGSNQIEFFGPTCDAIKNGEISDVDIVFGCATLPPD